MLTEIKPLARFAWGLPGFLARPLDRETCLAWIKASQTRRVETFFHTIEKAIFGKPASPYYRLLKHAGIDLVDMRQMASSDGLEAMLEKLHGEGVYVRLDEFKGRRPIERGSLRIDVAPHDFDNPLANSQLALQTGGSRSEGTRLYVDLVHYESDAHYDYAFLEAHGHLDRAYALWRPTPPYGAGIKAALGHVKLGLPVERWFTQRPHSWKARGKIHRLVNEYISLASRFSHHPLPRPEYTPVDRAIVVAQWLAQKRQQGKPGLLNTTASAGVRVALAAIDHDLDIEGSFFRLGGEPLSAGKAEIFKRARTHAVCHYTMGEVGRIGVACANPLGSDDVHMLTDKIAVIMRPRETGPDQSIGINVHTTLQSYTPKLLLNVESDDYGILEERHCGCGLEKIGYKLHMRQIRSVDKLTSEGMTFIGDDLVNLVEQILPGRFGGDATDWQFVEEEMGGLPKVCLLASPRIGKFDDQTVIDTVVDFLNNIPKASDNYGDRWRQADTLQIRREMPIATGASKVLALHIARPKPPA